MADRPPRERGGHSGRRHRAEAEPVDPAGARAAAVRRRRGPPPERGTRGPERGEAGGGVGHAGHAAGRPGAGGWSGAAARPSGDAGGPDPAGSGGGGIVEWRSGRRGPGRAAGYRPGEGRDDRSRGGRHDGLPAGPGPHRRPGPPDRGRPRHRVDAPAIVRSRSRPDPARTGGPWPRQARTADPSRRRGPPGPPGPWRPEGDDPGRRPPARPSDVRPATPDRSRGARRVRRRGPRRVGAARAGLGPGRPPGPGRPSDRDGRPAGTSAGTPDGHPDRDRDLTGLRRPGSGSRPDLRSWPRPPELVAGPGLARTR